MPQSLPKNRTNYFAKHLLVLCISTFFTIEALPQTPFCPSEKEKTKETLLNQFKNKFIQEMTNHYNNISLPKEQITHHMKKYKNPLIKVCHNPHNQLQKVVYIEYEKNWWGSLYFATINNGKLTKWEKINTHGATTKKVRWNNKTTFSYNDSTHQGTKTQNTCTTTNNKIICKQTN